MRLAKYLASAGVASRRAAEELIRAGRVTVGGETVTDPAFGVGDSDAITFDGQPVAATESVTRVVYAVNKPLGVVSTASDPQGRPTIVSLVRTAARLYPVGRLDADTTGLILLTNDGDLAHRLTHPSFEVEKTYRARLGGGPVRDTALRRLRAGVQLEDGMTSPARVRRVGAERARAHDPRGPQTSGAADVRGGRPSRPRPGAGPLRTPGRSARSRPARPGG